MDLIYKLEFNTTNSYYKDIINELIKKYNIKAQCKQYLDYLLIKFDDKNEDIENFFIYLENKLPLSIFRGKTEIFTKKMSEDLCKDTELEEYDVKLNLSLFTNDEIANLIETSQIDFSNDINKIKDGGISRLETRNGLKNIFLPSLKHKKYFEERNQEVRLLITNINKVSEILELEPHDTDLICSIERPLVKVKVRKDSNIDNIYSNTDYIYVKIADDKETVLFSEALNKEGISYLIYVSDEIYQNALKVISFNDQNIIVNGDKGLFPKIDYFTKEKYYSAKNYFDENRGVFNSILQKHITKDKSFLGVYFSIDSKESAFKIKKDNEIIDIIKIPNVKNNFLHYLEKISQMNEDAANTILEYKKAFPKNLEHLEFDNNSNSFKTMLNHIALVLGEKNYHNVKDLSLLVDEDDASELFEINTLVVNNKTYLDFRNVLLNIMKLKLNSLSNERISYIFFKSLSMFISKYIKKQENITSIILCGNLFSNKVLLKNTYRNLINEYSIVLPKAYPLDY